MESSFGIHVGVIQCKVVGLSSRLHKWRAHLVYYLGVIQCKVVGLSSRLHRWRAHLVYILELYSVQ